MKKIKDNAVTDKIIKVEKFPWKNLKAYQPQGLKKTTPDMLSKLKKSLVANGMASTYYVWQRGKDVYSLDGHHRNMALQELENEGMAIPEKFMCAFLDIKTEAEAKQVFLAYQSHYAKIDVSGFDEFTIDMDLNQLSSTFEPFTLKWGFKSTAHDEIHEQDLPTVENYISKTGDSYDLISTKGVKHRLLCGDAASDGLKEFIGDDAPVMVFTDPPYGVSYSEKLKLLNAKVGGKSVTRKIVGDNLSPSALYDMLLPIFKNIYRIMRADCSFYVTAPQNGDLGMMMMMMMMKDAGLLHRHVLIWVKNHAAFSMNHLDYDYQHEPILYGWKQKHKFYGGGVHKTSIWKIDRPMKSPDHPTMKPVELVVNAILNSTKAGDIVFDAFTGSGTTLIACEETGRSFRGVEIEPHYCDIILRRWLNYSQGGKILRNGKPFDFE